MRNNNERHITSVPARMEPFGGIGWTVYSFTTAKEAADFVSTNRDAMMPCWHRFEIVDGDLMMRIEHGAPGR